MTGPFSHELYFPHHQHRSSPATEQLDVSLNAVQQDRGSPTPSTTAGHRWLPSHLLVVVSLSITLWVFGILLDHDLQTEEHQIPLVTTGDDLFNFASYKWNSFSEDPAEDHAESAERVSDLSGFRQGSVPTSTSKTLFHNAPVPTLIHLRRNEEDNSQVLSSDSNLDSNINLPSNPQIYGWTPDLYPNPLLDPVRCSIAFLPEEQQAIVKQYAEGEDQENNPGPLRLCDPDWMLGGMYMEQIAFALRNFSNFFSQPDWDVNVESVTVLSTEEEVGHAFSTLPPTIKVPPALVQPRVELAVATVRKMNLPAVLREGSYYVYEDEDDMVNDAAQIFARTLHDTWWGARNKGDYCNQQGDQTPGEDALCQPRPNGDFGILIFLSIQDRVCFISTGNSIASILPWWRLEHIVASMKPDLRHRDYGNALLRSIEYLSSMLETGPPTMTDRLHDFISRFGVVIAFALFTFFFGAWGEYRDRRKRWQYAESRSKLSGGEKEKARLLQKKYNTTSCPICLELFHGSDIEEQELHPSKFLSGSEMSPLRLPDSDDNDYDVKKPCGGGMRRVDSYGIPLVGCDGKKIKMLRCGHIFCDSCWKTFAHSPGCGNPCICPVCRQDVGKPPKKSSSTLGQRDDRSAAYAATDAVASATIVGPGESANSSPLELFGERLESEGVQLYDTMRISSSDGARVVMSRGERNPVSELRSPFTFRFLRRQSASRLDTNSESTPLLQRQDTPR